MIPLGAVPSIIACLSYAYFAAFALSLDRKSATVRLFVVVELCFFLWSGSVIGIIVCGEGAEGLSFWQRMAYFGAGVYAIAGFFLFKNIGGFRFGRRCRPLIGPFLLPIAAVQLANIGWNAVATQFPAGFFYLAHQVITNAYSVAGLILIASWGLRSGLRRERRQAAVIVVSTLAGIPLGVVLDFYMGHRGLPSQGNLVPAVWSALIFFAIARYGLFRDSASSTDLAIVLSSPSATLVLDPGLRTAAANQAMRNLVGTEDVGRLSLDALFMKGPWIRKTLAALGESKGNTLEVNDLLYVNGGGLKMVGLQFMILRDRWLDPIKVLCFIHPIPRLDRVVADFSLSPREQDVMACILSGASQLAIADTLCISLPTVKTHTSNLYNKLGIDSRTELFSLLNSDVKLAAGV